MNLALPQTGLSLRERIPSEVLTAPCAPHMSLARFTSLHHLPIKTAAMGVCSDGQPLILDLCRGHSGPIVLFGDSGSGKTSALQSLALTAAAFSTPYQLQYMLICGRPDEWQPLVRAHQRSGHCRGFLPCYERQAGEAIIHLAAIAERRHDGRQRGPAIMLLLDDLAFITRADFDVRLNLDWLFKNGPEVEIWPVASLRTVKALETPRWVGTFTTRAYGNMPVEAASRLGGSGHIRTDLLSPGQFAARTAGEWVEFTTLA